MATKVMAAKIAVAAGCSLCIAAGRQINPLRRIEAGAPLHLVPGGRLAGHGPQAVDRGSAATGRELVVDEGAARALRSGKSLLPAGVVEVKGRFDRGDAVGGP